MFLLSFRRAVERILTLFLIESAHPKPSGYANPVSEKSRIDHVEHKSLLACVRFTVILKTTEPPRSKRRPISAMNRLMSVNRLSRWTLRG